MSGVLCCIPTVNYVAWWYFYVLFSALCLEEMNNCGTKQRGHTHFFGLLALIHNGLSDLQSYYHYQAYSFLVFHVSIPRFFLGAGTLVKMQFGPEALLALFESGKLDLAKEYEIESCSIVSVTCGHIEPVI